MGFGLMKRYLSLHMEDGTIHKLELAGHNYIDLPDAKKSISINETKGGKFFIATCGILEDLTKLNKIQIERLD